LRASIGLQEAMVLDGSRRVSLPITCDRYESSGDSRRCKHFLAGGACKLPSEFMCIEWQKANPGAPPRPAPVAEPPSLVASVFGDALSDPLDDLLGLPEDLGAPTAASDAERVPSASSEASAGMALSAPRHVAVQIVADALGGEVWLVPAYTNANRRELTFADAQAIASIFAAVPGARIGAIVCGNNVGAVSEVRPQV
jgi:hypothetical protein